MTKTNTLDKMATGRTSLLAATALTASFIFPIAADAADNFTIRVTTNGTTGSATAKTIEEFADLGLKSSGLDSVNAAYTDTSVATADLNFRGLPMVVTFPDSGPGLIYSIPELGFTRAFNAQSTREANGDDLEDYLKNDIDGLLSKVLDYLVSETGTDPVAGNPASLQGTMIAGDFTAGTGLGPGNGSQASTGDGGGEGRRNVYGIGARLGQYSVNGNDITTIDLPLTFVRPLEDPRYALIIDMPLTFVDTNGSETVAASLGVGMRVPITTRWTLTPMLRAGATGSVDLGSLAALYSGSLSSSYKFNWGQTEINIGNMLSYISTTDVSDAIDDYQVDYDLQNTVSRNGVGFSGPLSYKLFGAETTWEASVVNTQIFGDAVYIDNYTDMAVSFGTKQSRNGLTWDAIRIGFTYTVGNNDFQGGRINFGYQF
ncbi:hypothetical protein [Meridianimarinicoccus aquatilis]|uniref:Autotransporter outer membrane beta-barrel domain-containing protein n=1 Tax=Meridianimarinicoccus aquatilis TaxID=2552766 RepID=A0A4R6AS88_9RHOB|nr:hypothetical protein [Fluviibacterium aquatile]QIE43485.1 hypothetical protein G5B39_15780 [Rhodobacteraceae bacterium SC52]TDL85488.1 hypothetical protein E2L05_15360 [Fluviibacterium aquatile]